MRLRYVELQNFRQHAESHIEFPAEGVIGLVGQNESGKSSILEAIQWALYGARATRGTMKGIRWNRAPARKTAGVELAFEVGGKPYTIQRGESDARVYEDGQGEPIAAGIAAVDDFVPRLIGMSLPEFRATFLCEQKDLGRLQSMGGTERRQFMLSVLGIGQIDEALKACRSRKNSLATEAAAIQTGLGEREPLAAEVAEARDTRETASASLHESKTRLADVEAEKAAAVEAWSALEAVREGIRKIRQNRALAVQEQTRAREEAGRVRSEIQKLGPIRFDPERLSLTEAQFAELEDRLRVLVEGRHDAIHEARVASQTAGARLDETGTEIRRLEALGTEGRCPTCTQKLDAEHLEAVLARLREQHAEHLNVRQEADRRIRGVGDPSDGELALRAERDALAGQIEELRNRKAGAARLEGLESDLVRLLEQTAEAAEARIAELDTAAEGLAFDEDAYGAAVARRDETARAEGDARTALARFEAEARAATDRLQRAERALADYDVRAEKLRDIAAELDTHKRADVRLTEFRAAMASGIGPELEELASGFVSILTDGRHEGMLLDDDFNARLLEGGIETEVVSGGTEDIAAIALRLAISQMIAERAGHPLSLLVLDEPFGSLDAVRRESVLTLIRRLSSVFQQVILITHIEEAREAVDYAIEVEFDEREGRSVVREPRGMEVAA